MIASHKNVREAVFMLCIGILGENLKEQTIEQIIYFVKQYADNYVCFCGTKKEKEFEQAYQNAQNTENSLFLIPIYAKTIKYCKSRNLSFSIFLYLGNTKNDENTKEDIAYLAKHTILVVNTDDRRVFPLKLKTGNKLITCGLNHRASVTLSSYLEPMAYEKGKIQCCIQREIPTVSGNIFEPQEFSLLLEQGQKSVSSALAAITALIAADVEFGDI